MTLDQRNEEAALRAGYMVLQLEDDGLWRELGEARRLPGLTARAARFRAVEELANDKSLSATFAAVPLSEWRTAIDIDQLKPR